MADSFGEVGAVNCHRYGSEAHQRNGLSRSGLQTLYA